MAGGPIYPFSRLPITPLATFSSVHFGLVNDRREEGMGVRASLDQDGTWELRFETPQVLPTGTPRLRLLALAHAEAGEAKVNPAWVSVAPEESPDTAILNAEGTQTLSWGVGDNDQYKELQVVLDADTVIAGELIVMHLNFETTGWTLAVVSTWQASIIWV